MTLRAALCLLLLSATLSAAATPPHRLVYTRPSEGLPALREDGNALVLLDIEGPGILREIRAEDPAGLLAFTFDGADTPQLVVPFDALDAGPLAPFDVFLLREDSGSVRYLLPMTFAESLEIRWTGNTTSSYRLEADLLPRGVTTSWHPGRPLDEETRARLNRLADAIEDPLSARPSGQLVRLPRQLLFDGADPIVYTVPDGRTVAEIRVLSEEVGPSPDALRVTFGDERPRPWKELVEVSPAGPERGRVGASGYLRDTALLATIPRLAFSWEAGRPGEFFPRIEIVLTDETPTPPRAGEPQDTVTTDPEKVGEVFRQADGTVARRVAPVAFASAPPPQRSGSGFTGVYTVDVRADGLSRLAARLDLPFGWRGTLRATQVPSPELNGHEARDVHDIGWPPLEYDRPAAGLYAFAYEAIPPPDVPLGTFTIQPRVEAFSASWARHETRAPHVVPTLPGSPPAATLDPRPVPGLPGEVAAELPHDFTPRPGDHIIARLRGDGAWSPDHHRAGRSLLFEPVANAGNSDVFSPEATLDIPPDGQANASFLLLDEDPLLRTAVYTVGSAPSWMGTPRVVRLAPMDQHLESLTLHRAPPPPKPEGWSRTVPYLEDPPGTFRFTGIRAHVAGSDLLRRLHVAVGPPGLPLEPRLRPATFLENIDAGPLRWQFARPLRREGNLPPARTIVLAPPAAGTRIALHDDRIAGHQFFGFEFGYGPRGARVAIRDCEGRLVAVHDTFLPAEVALPHYLWVALPFPSRDPWIYLEVLGPAPASHGLQLALQKVLFVEPGAIR